ncbi:hypothetical protein HYX18_04960 [Candidatus Woesearchaeota archaeon]|nr:hypothetical protein [Candidatus Woesearchaeota archaeon]
MIQLGGNITLDGFELEPSTLVIVKKIVGNYAKNIYTNISNFENLSIKLKQNHPIKEIESSLLIDNNEVSVVASDPNLFFALDRSLAMLVKKAKPE